MSLSFLFSIVKDYPVLGLALQQIIPKASAHNVRNTLLQSDDDEGEYDGIDLSVSCLLENKSVKKTSLKVLRRLKPSKFSSLLYNERDTFQ